jgi:hypothetical protein
MIGKATDSSDQAIVLAEPMTPIVKRFVVSELRRATGNRFANVAIGIFFMVIAAVLLILAAAGAIERESLGFVVGAVAGSALTAVLATSMLGGSRRLSALRRAEMFLHHPTHCTIRDRVLTLQYGTLSVDVSLSKQQADRLLSQTTTSKDV